jgi:hypothetical protein
MYWNNTSVRTLGRYYGYDMFELDCTGGGVLKFKESGIVFIKSIVPVL